jgi:hypothetical protein
VFVEQCRELDIAIAATSAGAATMARQALLRRQAAAAAAVVATAASGAGSGAGAGSGLGSSSGRPPMGSSAIPGAGQVRLTPVDGFLLSNCAQSPADEAL